MSQVGFRCNTPNLLGVHKQGQFLLVFEKSRHLLMICTHLYCLDITPARGNPNLAMHSMHLLSVLFEATAKHRLQTIQAACSFHESDKYACLVKTADVNHGRSTDHKGRERDSNELAVAIHCHNQCSEHFL